MGGTKKRDASKKGPRSRLNSCKIFPISMDFGRGRCVKYFAEMSYDGISIADMNEAYMALIPKIQNPSTMVDFCPISLCNVV